MRILGINNTINFQRRPTREEEQDLKSTVDKAYDIMGTKERAVITHGSCFPSIDRDTYIGSPYGKAAKEYIKFLNLYGFNSVQLGPGGELEKDKVSPYNSSAFAKNRLFIDLKELTQDKYGNILSKETFEKVTKLPDYKKDYDMTDFVEAEHTYNIALKESFKNFKANLAKGQPQTIALDKEYQTFLQKHNRRLTEEGLFKVLAKQYGTEDSGQWPNDEYLIGEYNRSNPYVRERYTQLIEQNRYEIEQYKFEQFIATKQIKENKEWRDKLGFKYMNDLLVGCSKMDEWRYKDAFLEGYQLGAYEYNSNPQTWNVPVLNPRMLFRGDDLGPAGQFLKDKINFALEFNENLRIDHAMGLIEPFVIENDSIIYDENEKIINTPENPVNSHYMSEMYAADGKKLDDYKNYSSDYIHPDGHVTYFSKIMDKIVIPTLKENSIDPDSVLWEDVCSQPKRFQEVFYNTLNLPGIIQTEWAKVEKGPESFWYLVGSHDSIPAQEMIKRDYTKNSAAWNPLYLAGYLHQNTDRAEERDNFCKKIANNDRELVFAKFSELMTAHKFQISFDDLLGITDQIYNIPGSTREDNWKKRIPADFLDKYYENLSSENPTALNIPEILKTALQAKIDMSTDKDELYEKYQPVIDKLDHYAQILKE